MFTNACFLGWLSADFTNSWLMLVLKLKPKKQDSFEKKGFGRTSPRSGYIYVYLDISWRNLPLPCFCSTIMDCKGNLKHPRLRNQTKPIQADSIKTSTHASLFKHLNTRTSQRRTWSEGTGCRFQSTERALHSLGHFDLQRWLCPEQSVAWAKALAARPARWVRARTRIHVFLRVGSTRIISAP